MVKCHHKEKIWYDYYDWLIDRVGLKRKKRYSKLLSDLYNIPFRFSIPLDKNREADGLNLREEFALNIGYPEIKFEHDCSVLEMLIGLAIRVEYEYIGDPIEEHPERFFWEMVENLFDMDQNFRICEDLDYDRSFVVGRVEAWLDRRFKPNGYGSIFPLHFTDRDQRKIEIWSQMNEYLSERYPV